mmetsp:Transcript_66312/g.184702  ORF Transcript_66312/g.184702 Transcript_66312/m.184702 type:complete len:225 (-) Transcript_66312:277-951(-)
MDDGMVNKVILIISLDALIVINSVGAAYFFDLLWRASKAHNARMKLLAIIIDLRNGVAVGVNADEDRRGHGTELLVQKLDCVCLLLHFLWTNVWAEREAEVDEQVLALIIGVCPHDTLPVYQLEWPTQLRGTDSLVPRGGPLLVAVLPTQVVVVPQAAEPYHARENGRTPCELDVVSPWRTHRPTVGLCFCLALFPSEWTAAALRGFRCRPRGGRTAVPRRSYR